MKHLRVKILTTNLMESEINMKYFEAMVDSDCIEDMSFIFYNDLSDKFPKDSVVYYRENATGGFTLHLFLGDDIYSKQMVKERAIWAFATYLERFKNKKDKPKEIKLEDLLYS